MGKILDVTTEEQTKLWAEAHEEQYIAARRVGATLH